jgi:undecaprenyl-diphosphatase
MLIKYITASDIFLLRIFNHKIKCKSLDFAMPLLTYLGSCGFMITFSLSSILYPSNTVRLLGRRVLAALLLSTLIVKIIKTSVSRIRPFLKIQNLNIMKIGIDQYSFPSGHTAAAFSLGITVALSVPGLSLICILLAVSVGISRMYLGVHYPTDVLAGSIIGTLSSFLFYFII